MAGLSILNPKFWGFTPDGTKLISYHRVFVLSIQDSAVVVYIRAHGNYFHNLYSFDYHSSSEEEEEEEKIEEILEAGSRVLTNAQKFAQTSCVLLDNKGENPKFKCVSCGKISQTGREAFDHFVGKHRLD